MTDKLLDKILFIILTILCLVIVFCGVGVWFAASGTIIFKLIVSILCICSGIAFEALSILMYRTFK